MTHKIVKTALPLFLTVLMLVGCAATVDVDTEDREQVPQSSEEPEATEPFTPELVLSCQAEDGICSGNTYVSGGFVTGFREEGDIATVEFTMDEAGFYDLEFMNRSSGGHKENYALVDGVSVGCIAAEGARFCRSCIRRVYLSEGMHTVSVSSYWGYIDWDKVDIYTAEPFDESVFEVSASLCSPNATENARRLMSYLCDTYGKFVISGQYCDTGMNGWENLKIFENTGKYPAILGADMGNYAQTAVDHGAVCSTTEQAIICWDKGGIVTLCWHWLAPEKYIRRTWYKGFRSEEVSMNLSRIMNGEDPEGLELLHQDIAAIAAELLKMQDAGVPILWRPLHEASGGWFWWGKEGAEPYKKLYVYLYDTLTNEFGLNNLIWLWNGQDAEWYPGDEYVDIIGLDVYPPEHGYASQINAFLDTLAMGGGRKMVVLSENGTMPDPELMARDRAMWGFFCTWGGEFVITDNLRIRYSEQYTEIPMLKKIYGSDIVITRDELPDLKTYPIRGDAQ